MTDLFRVLIVPLLAIALGLSVIWLTLVIAFSA